MDASDAHACAFVCHVANYAGKRARLSREEDVHISVDRRPLDIAAFRPTHLRKNVAHQDWPLRLGSACDAARLIAFLFAYLRARYCLV